MNLLGNLNFRSLLNQLFHHASLPKIVALHQIKLSIHQILSKYLSRQSVFFTLFGRHLSKHFHKTLGGLIYMLVGGSIPSDYEKKLMSRLQIP